VEGKTTELDDKNSNENSLKLIIRRKLKGKKKEAKRQEKQC
jgi:hypothetical protein